MSESDTMFNERDRRCVVVQLMLSTDPNYDNRTIATTLKMQIWIATNNRDVLRVMKTKIWVMVQIGSSAPHCAKWADDHQSPAGLEPRLVPDLTTHLIPTIINLRIIDLVSSPVSW